MNGGVIEIDLHGLNAEEAKRRINSTLKNTTRATYRVRLIHGYHGGTNLRSMIMEEYSYCRDEKVIRVQGGNNPGITELILREL